MLAYGIEIKPTGHTKKQSNMIDSADPTGYLKCGACDRKVLRKGYCGRHLRQIETHGRLTPEREHQQRGPKCSVAGCNRKPWAKGMCSKHLHQIRKHGRLTPERERQMGKKTCQVCGKKVYARGLCLKHYQAQHYKEKNRVKD